MIEGSQDEDNGSDDELLIVEQPEIKDPDVGKDMVSIVQSKGYPIQQHFATTKDGYILGVYRIPHGRNGAFSDIKAKPVVFLQHGLLDSSYTWVNNFPHQSLGFILADNGFDVWMGNNRGNTWSRRHVSRNVNSDAFWDFTFEDMGKNDLPTQIEFVLNATGQTKLTYVGHSQGTTQAFAGFSINPSLAARVNLFVALAPVSYLSHQTSLLLSLLSTFDVIKLIELFGFREFLPDATLLQKIAPGICNWVPWGCEDFLFLLTGFSDNLNSTRIQVYVSETPAGTSVKNMDHWAQAEKNGKFQMYDYGCGIFSCENQKRYGQKQPPQFDLTKVKVPTALYYGDHDTLGNPKDVVQLIQELPNIVFTQRQPSYAHLDYVWAVNANTLVFQSVLNLIKKYASP